MSMKVKRAENHVALVSFEGLRGNGLIFARRETVRAARRLHLVCDYSFVHDTVIVSIYTARDENRLAELWKYLRGTRFQRKILNNGYWEEE